MRISSGLIFNQGTNNITNQESKLYDTFNQISSGKKITVPSDDPLNIAQVVLLRQEHTRLERFTENATRADGRLKLAESTIGNVNDVLRRVRELELQAANSTLSQQDRDAIVSELDERLNQLLSLANQQDTSGNYIFSGYQSRGKAYVIDSAGNYVYNGDDGARKLEVASGLYVDISDSGFDLFENIRQGNGTFKITANPANTGTAVSDAGSVIDTSAYVQDTYTVTFVTNSSGELAYQVVGATSGQLVPALPAIIPDDAPAYQSGQAMTFNGIEMTLKGDPDVGDIFTVEPSRSQNIFTTVQQAITTIKTAGKTPTEQAAARNKLYQAMAGLDVGMQTLTDNRTKIGARMQILDKAQDINQDLNLQTSSLLSSIENLDQEALTEAMTRFKAQTIALEAAQQSFIHIQNLNIFNYL